VGYGTDLPSAVACLADDFDVCIARLRFPLVHRRAIRTTNLFERLFGEERRRTKVIPHAFGERAVLKLMHAALIRAAERWRGLKMSDFERRQLKAIRDGLDRDFAALTATIAEPKVTAPQLVDPANRGLDLLGRYTACPDKGRRVRAADRCRRPYDARFRVWRSLPQGIGPPFLCRRPSVPANNGWGIMGAATLSPEDPGQDGYIRGDPPSQSNLRERARQQRDFQ
jgi:hypothetical protein